MTPEQQKALALLHQGGVMYANRPDECDEEAEELQTLNMNDTFGWALAWGEYVPDEKLVEVAALFYHYGAAGLEYWVSEQNNQCRSEFYDVQRHIDFVRREERIKVVEPNYDKRAYLRVRYTVGESGLSALVRSWYYNARWAGIKARFRIIRWWRARKAQKTVGDTPNE